MLWACRPRSPLQQRQRFGKSLLGLGLLAHKRQSHAFFKEILAFTRVR